MAKEREVTEVVRGFTGQKSAVPNGTLAISDASKIMNFTVRKGRLRKIWGAPLYADPGLGANVGVNWIDRFRQSWFFQRGEIIAKETAEGSAEFTGVGTFLLGESTRVRSDKWRNRLYMVNGVENRFYEDSLAAGAKFLKLGITPPGNNRTTTTDPGFADLLALTSSAGGTLSGIYQYCFTWYDSIRGVESLSHDARIGPDGLWSAPHFADAGPGTGGDPDLTFPDAGNQTAVIDISHAKDLGYDTDRVNFWILYRREIDNVTGLPLDDYKRVLTSNSLGSGEIPEAIPIANDTTQDDGSEDPTVVLNEANSPPPAGQFYIDENFNYVTGNYGPRFIRRHNDQLWLFGVRFPGRPFTLPSGEIEFEKASGIAYASGVSQPDYWQYTYDIAYADDQKDTGLAKYRNTLMFWKERSIYYLDGTNPENYAIRELDPQRGCVAPGSLQETPIGVIALSADGFILVDSASPAKLISNEIFDEIQNINFEASDKVISAYDIREGKYECHVPMRSSLNANQVFVFDINTRTWDFRNKKIGGSAKFELDSGGNRVALLGDPNNGRVYDLADETSVTFNGQKIFGRWASKSFDFGDPDKNKRLVSMRLKARCKERFFLDIDVIMDDGQQDSFSLRDIDSETVFTTWAANQSDNDGDELILDQGQWSDEFTWKKFEILLSGVARNFKVVIRESGITEASEGFEIDEITFVGNMLGR